MADWKGFEIVCVDLDEELEYNDCRAIKQIGILAPSLTLHDHDIAWASLKKRPYWYHVNVDGKLIHPEPAKDGNRKYIRISEDLPEDSPLLQLPTCAEYKLEHQLQSL